MKLLIMILTGLVFLGCAPVQKGDYITYTSNEYLFLADSFIDQSIDCLELGEMKQGGMDAKYCVGENYASKLVQGFVFEHHYEDVNERFIGATLSFERKKEVYSIPCSSETIDGKNSGREYINCMVQQRSFDLYSFIINSSKEIHGTFRAAVGDGTVYRGVIDKDGKALLYKFYKDRATNSKKNWKSKSL